MAVTHTLLTSGSSTTDTTSYATASITPGANKLILAWVVPVRNSGTTGTVTLSGNGLTWTQVRTEIGSTVSMRGALFRAMGASPTAGVVTITTSAQSNGCTWILSEFDGVVTTGTDGADAVVQSNGTNSASATSLSVTLSAFADAGNATFGAFGHRNSDAVTGGSGFTEIADVLGTGPDSGSQTEWRADNDTSVDASWTNATVCVAVAVEIKAAVTSTTFLPTAVSIPLSVPSPTVALGDLSLVPSPVPIPLSVPSLVIAPGALTVLLAPVSVPLSVPNPTVALGNLSLTPSPVPIPLSVPSITMTLGDLSLAPAAVSVALSVPGPTVALGALSLVPSPVLVPMAAPSPTVALGELTVALAPVAIPLSVTPPAVTLGDLILLPAPVAVPLVVPNITFAFTILFDLAPVPVPLAVPSPAVALGDLALNPQAVSVPLVVPGPSLALSLELSPSAVAIPLIVAPPTLDMTYTLALSPVAVSLSVTDPTVTLGDLTLLLDPATVTLLVPEIDILQGTQYLLMPALVTLEISAPAIVPGALTVTFPAVTVPLVVPEVGLGGSTFGPPGGIGGRFAYKPVLRGRRR